MSTGPINNNAAAAQARAEAQRRAAEEARRKAAEEARRKAAEEARKKAQEAAAKKAAEEASKKAREAAAKKAAEELGSSKSENRNFLQRLTDGPREALAKSFVQKVSAEEAKAEHQAIREDLKNAKTPEDVAKATDRAQVLQGRLSVSDDPKITLELRQNVEQTRNRLERAGAAVEQLEQAKAELSGTPEERANATARLLSNPEEFQKAVADLAPLAESPVIGPMRKTVNAIADKADPAALASQLQQQPDLSQYPPEMAENLVTLRQLPDPQMQAALDAVGENLLERGVSYQQVQDNPTLGKLLAPLQNSSDPAVREKLAETVQGWAEESISRNLEGKKKKEGVEEAMEAFKGEMTELAKETGLGPTIQQVGPEAVEARKDDIEDTAKKGRSIFEKIGGVFGDVLGGIGDFFDKGFDVVGDVVGAVGDVAGKGVDLLGDGVNLATDGMGKLYGGAIRGAGSLAANGLDLAGADGLAKNVRESSQAAGDFVENAADKVGDVQNSFVDGVGGAVKGTTDGLKFIAQNPTQAAQGIYMVGKAAVTGDTETLKMMGKAIADEAFINPKTGKFDIAYGTGYIAANVVPMLVTGGGSGAVTGANAATKGAQAATTAARAGGAANAASRAGRLSNFAARTDQLLDTARAVTELDVGGIAKGVGNLTSDVARGGDDAARLSRARAFADNPREYVSNYANHLRGEARTAQAQASRTARSVRDGIADAARNPGQAWDNLTSQAGKTAKRAKLYTKLAGKEALRGLKTRDLDHFKKAIEYMSRNPVVQGLGTAIDRGSKVADMIDNPLKPILGRFEDGITRNFEGLSRVQQRGTEVAMDSLQGITEQQQQQKPA